MELLRILAKYDVFGKMKKNSWNFKGILCMEIGTIKLSFIKNSK